MNKSSLSPFIPNKEKYQKYVDEIYANGWVSNNGPELEEKDQNLILGIIKQKLKGDVK